MPAPLAPPRDLTIPEPGSTTLRDLLGRYLRVVMRRFLELPAGRLAPARARELDLVRRLVSERLARDAGPVWSLVRLPTFSVLVNCAHAALGAPDGGALAEAHVGELCESALCYLALAGEIPQPVSLERPVRRLSSLAHRFALELDAPARSVRFASGRIEIDVGDRLLSLTSDDLAETASWAADGARLTRPFHPIRDGIHLVEIDNNPLSGLEAHPEKRGSALDLGGRPVAEWVAALGEAFALVDRYLPGVAAEMRLLLHQIVPVGYDAEQHLSASYLEAIGTIYLSLHPNQLTMAEALIHEFQHNKVNVLFQLDPVLRNAFHPLYTSPVRPDPRPLHGVLLAVHAFQPVARLYEEMDRAGDPRLARPEVRRRYRQVVALTRQGCEVLLPNAQPTVAGRGLLDEIARWDRHYAELAIEAPG